MSKEENIKKLWENQLKHMSGETTNGDDTTDSFPSLLPIAMKVAAKTISQDLFFGDTEKMKEIETRIDIENRDGKIDSLVENKPFVEKRKEDDPVWLEESKKGVTPLSAPSGNLFYIDFSYGSTNSNTI